MPNANEGGGLRAAALAYATVVPIFPCQPGAKQPATAGGFKAATQRRDAVLTWWADDPNFNIGFPIPPGMLVVDVDPRNGGTIPEDLPPTRIASTPSGGFHLYYRVPRGLKYKATVAQGVDLKSEGKGYVLLPPSVVGGKPYRWVTNPTEPLAELDPGKFDMLKAPPPIIEAPEATGALLPFEEGTDYGLTVRAHRIAELAVAPEGGRNHALNKAAYVMGQLVAGGQLREDETLHQILLVAERIGLDPTEALATIRSGFEAGARNPREPRR